MAHLVRETVTLHEYKPEALEEGEFSWEAAELLVRGPYSGMVDVEGPTPLNQNHWLLTAQGWVGFIPLTEDLALSLQPKTSISNLFGMFEYAYRLQSFHFGHGLIGTQSLQEVYEQLASVLARRILDRSRKGLYRAYLPEHERLAYIRGRFDVMNSLRHPWDTNVRCHFHEHTADVEENQILAWTLWRIVRSGYCSERVLPVVRQAYRAVQGFASLRPFAPEACDDRLYHRLNQDYHPLHALSRFFLAQSGPSHTIGKRQMVPFVVDMARLYEKFVAEWLATHGPSHWRVRAQASLPFGSHQQQSFRPDIIVEDASSGRSLMVLDTKYKTDKPPAEADIAQMVAYAVMTGCRETALIYPALPENSETYWLQGIRVHCVAFAIDGDLEEAGRQFLATIEGLV